MKHAVLVSIKKQVYKEYLKKIIAEAKENIEKYRKRNLNPNIQDVNTLQAANHTIKLLNSLSSKNLRIDLEVYSEVYSKIKQKGIGDD